MAEMGFDLVVDRANVANIRHVARAPRVAAQDGDIVCRVDDYAFTSNNLTYAVTGNTIGYWKFFPTTDAATGIVPVWGFATVTASKHPDIAVGDVLYGYWPMASDVVLSATSVGKGGLTDGAAHRAKLPAVYNRYTRIANDPSFTRENSAHQALLRPLFLTSFLIDDFLDDNAFFGARQVLIASASSKTAIGLAAMLAKRRSSGLRIVGLTSPSNQDFVRGLGFYDDVVLYDAISTMPVAPAVLVDMAGSQAVLEAVHTRFGDHLKHSCRVGLSHWQDFAPQPSAQLAGPKPKFFFAPDRIALRLKDWSPAGFQTRTGAALAEFVADAPRWLAVEHVKGHDAQIAAYRATADGKVPPQRGLMFSR
jgi:hypothetical protein